MKKIIILLLNDISKMKFKIQKTSLVNNYWSRSRCFKKMILRTKDFVRICECKSRKEEKVVDSNINLPKNLIVMILFRPRNSLSIVSNDYLKNKFSKRSCKKNYQDVFSFNQLGCNSPHNLYLEKGSIISHKIFIKILLNFFEINPKN